MDWLSLTVPASELVVRGSMMYLLLFAIFRFVLRRDAGPVGISDFLFVIIVADAAQNAMIGDGKSVGDGAVLITTLAAWNYAMDWLAYRFDWFRKLTEPRPIALIRDGRPIARALRHEFITPEALATKMREEGIGDIRDVRVATLEPDGRISFIKRVPNQRPHAD